MTGCPAGRFPAGQRGMVTAELALGLPTLLLVLAVVLTAISASGEALRCQQAARAAARAATDGAPDGEVRRIAADQAPPAAAVGLAGASDGGRRITVRAPVPLPGLLRRVASWQVAGEAVAAGAAGR